MNPLFFIWEYVYFTFIPEGYFYWILNSSLTSFKNLVSPSSGFQWFLMRNLQSFELLFPRWECHFYLAAFNIFPLSLGFSNLILLCLAMDFFRFILFSSLSFLNLQVCIFAQLSKLSVIIYLNIFFLFRGTVLFLLIVPSWHEYYTFGVDWQVTEILILSIFSSPSSSDWVICWSIFRFTDPFSFSSPICCWVHSVNFFFQLLYI